MSNSLQTLQKKPVAGFDVARLREDFPILAREVHGKPLVYLDNAASAQKPKPVLDAMAKAYAETYANVHRGAHFLSGASTVAFGPNGSSSTSTAWGSGGASSKTADGASFQHRAVAFSARAEWRGAAMGDSEYG